MLALAMIAATLVVMSLLLAVDHLLPSGDVVEALEMRPAVTNVEVPEAPFREIVEPRPIPVLPVWPQPAPGLLATTFHAATGESPSDWRQTAAR